MAEAKSIFASCGHFTSGSPVPAFGPSNGAPEREAALLCRAEPPALQGSPVVRSAN